MNGVLYMILFVVIGGFLIVLVFVVGGELIEVGMVILVGSMWN